MHHVDSGRKMSAWNGCIRALGVRSPAMSTSWAVPSISRSHSSMRNRRAARPPKPASYPVLSSAPTPPSPPWTWPVRYEKIRCLRSGEKKFILLIIFICIHHVTSCNSCVWHLFCWFLVNVRRKKRETFSRILLKWKRSAKWWVVLKAFGSHFYFESEGSRWSCFFSVATWKFRERQKEEKEKGQEGKERRKRKEEGQETQAEEFQLWWGRQKAQVEIRTCDYVWFVYFLFDWTCLTSCMRTVWLK